MRDGRAWGLAILLGIPVATVIGGAFWLVTHDAVPAVVLGLSVWPFLVLGFYFVLRYRGYDVVQARERTGLSTEQWRSVRRVVAGKQTTGDPQVRMEAVYQLQRSAMATRWLIGLSAAFVVLAVLQTVWAFQGGGWFSALLTWVMVALTGIQIVLARTHGRRADALEAAADDSSSAI